MYSQQRKDNGDQSTIWRGHTKPTTSPKEEKEGGASAKGSVLILTCVSLPHLVLPLSGAPAQAPRQRQHEVRQGDTHDSGSAAIRGVPLPNPQRKTGDGPLRAKASRLGWEGPGYSCLTGCVAMLYKPLRPRRPTIATTQIPKGCDRIVTSLPQALPDRLW